MDYYGVLKRLRLHTNTLSKFPIWHFPNCRTHCHITQSCGNMESALSLSHAAPRVFRERERKQKTRRRTRRLVKFLIKQKLNFFSRCAQCYVWQKPGTIQYPVDTVPTVWCVVDSGKIEGRIKRGHIAASIEDKTEFRVVSGSFRDLRPGLTTRRRLQTCGGNRRTRVCCRGVMRLVFLLLF